LSNCLLMAQVKTVPDQVKVAYIGIQVKNVESWVKSELETKLNAIFNSLDPEKLIKSDEVNKLAKEEIETLFIEINDQYFQKIADKTGARYIFAGKFKNVSPDKSRIMIQGDFYRYNAQLKSSFRYEVLKYYERMNDEVKVIQQQMVDSMPYAPKPASLKQVTFVFTGIILIGLVFMTLTGTSIWQNGEGSGEGTKPPEN
ncbi:MAG: hypothetical protein QF453_06090, partial [Candidatus Marinimicrobia bacterium]|nr:hypothetical protein [Candidatus Neomarinimicrobiota bacterium]